MPSPPKPNPSSKHPGHERSPELTAYVVLKDDLEVGVLGTGPGPFQSASRKRATEVMSEHVQFASSHFVLEREVREAMQGPARLEEVRQRLVQAGFDLREIPFGRGLRVPGSQVEELAPEQRQELDEDVDDLTTGEAAGETR